MTNQKLRRCPWAKPSNPVYVRYHDEEWGKPSHDDGYLHEMFLLECFQAGLAWETILNKRENFRAAFDNFAPEKIAAYDEKKITELLANPGIIRHRKKIEAAVRNAEVFLRIKAECGSFDDYIWSFTNGAVVKNKDDSLKARSPLSDAVSADLKRRGMKFVGSVTIYSYLQAIGVVNDHRLDCDFRD